MLERFGKEETLGMMSGSEVASHSQNLLLPGVFKSIQYLHKPSDCVAY